MVDGWLRPLSNEGTHYVIEFDNWPNKEAYFKVGLAMAQAGLKGTNSVFSKPALEPNGCTEHVFGAISPCPFGLRV